MTANAPEFDNFTVGWICAIPTEGVAARAFLDERYEDPPVLAERDENSYTLGRIGKHYVVIAVLPFRNYGIASAATAARDMVRTFPNVRIGLMVGIGGGAPGPKHDIRLGDVVVSVRSDQNGYLYGGVYQYDFGKRIQDQPFQETAFINQPSRSLLTAVSNLRVDYATSGNKLESKVDAALNNIVENEEYVRPPPESDRLFDSNFVHPLDGCCDTVCSEYKDNGDKVIKDAILRDKLAKERGVLCFEMEAAGLMNDFPCLVIRGICDYSDSHKNDDWHGYAAMTAAAYARDLLQKIPARSVNTEKPLGEILGPS
ncbi:hypothetical protein VTH82DRAFT_96 [Thermothelomyces myriococcoides]